MTSWAIFTANSHSMGIYWVLRRAVIIFFFLLLFIFVRFDFDSSQDIGSRISNLSRRKMYSALFCSPKKMNACVCLESRVLTIELGSLSNGLNGFWKKKKKTRKFHMRKSLVFFRVRLISSTSREWNVFRDWAS